MNVSDPLTKTLLLAKNVKHREAMGVDCYCKLELLTLVQVGDCWKYALEAIINVLLFIFLFHN